MTDVSPAGGWLLLVFSLPAKHATARVHAWRQLRRYGALPLGSSGHVLPRTAGNEERFQWLATEIRKHKGEASVVRAESIDNLPPPALVKLFNSARAAEYDALAADVAALLRARHKPAGQTARLQRRLLEIVERDFFACPARGRVEALLARLEPHAAPSGRGRRRRSDYQDRRWVTRPRPGIDRVASAWLIRRFVDVNAAFVFADAAEAAPDAIPFDMFTASGFGHRGDDCTFETLAREFGISDPRVAVLAQAVHDADLDDEKFGRIEALGLARVLAGWNEQGLSDGELLRRGMEMIEGLYQAL
jgi:hypothetical protein